MERIIRTVTEQYKDAAAAFVETVFSEYYQDTPKGKEEGRLVRRMVEEIRAKRYYLPELELMMVDEHGEIMGYAMFSRFHIEGRYEDELLLLTPVAVKTELQRQHISKDLLEYGLKKARELGYKAVMVEGNPRNYNPRGFKTAADYGVLPGKTVHLPRIECLMIQELIPGALAHIQGTVEYSFYETLV